MKVILHVDKCIGSGSCEMLAPDVFEVRDDGLCHILLDEPGPDLIDRVDQAVEACPTRAIGTV